MSNWSAIRNKFKLSLVFSKTVGGFTPPAETFERTAFVSSTPGGTPALNDPSNPYPSISAAIEDLTVNYSEQSTTIRLLSNIAGMDTSTPELEERMLHGLSIIGHNNTVRTITGTMSFGGSQAGCLLNLSYVTIENLVKDRSPYQATLLENAGTITGGPSATLSYLDIRGRDGDNDGTTGADGNPSAVGSPNYGSGLPQADLNTNGESGGSITANGEDGTPGNNGYDGWEVTLLGSGIATFINLSGGNGKDGGNGGAGGNATGGHGQNGGDADGEGDLAGANGGAGGDAEASGGVGAIGGNGGLGGKVNYESGWTITAHDLSGGLGGTGGLGGVAGVANAGAGGAGGAGLGAGNAGDNGPDGTAENHAGADADPAVGSSGIDGSLVAL